MKLELYLRVKITPIIKKYYLKGFCEVCNNHKNLHLHHVKLFSELVSETLTDLKLDTKEDMKEYTQQELSNILNIVTGKHFYIDYLTLCGKCHKETHSENWSVVTSNKKYYDKLEMINTIKRNIYNKTVIIPFLNKQLNKVMLTRDDRVELITVLNFKENGRLLRSKESINKKLSSCKLNYEIVKFETSRSENGVRRSYKSAWKIKKLL